MIEKKARNHFWGSTNFEVELEEFLEEVYKELCYELFDHCDSYMKIKDLPKKYKLECIRRIIYAN